MDPQTGYATTDLSMSSPSVIAFLAVWIFGAGVWFLMMAEWMGVMRFWGWAFRIGFRLADFRTALNPSAWPAAAAKSGPNGVRVKQVSDTKALVSTLSTDRWPRRWGFVKGTIENSGGETRVQIRTSAFPWIFMALWLIGMHIAFLFFRSPIWAPETVRVLLICWAVLAGFGVMFVCLIRADLQRLRGFAERVGSSPTNPA